MRSSLYYILLLFSMVYLVSCESDNNLKSEDSDLLIGHWISPVYIDSLVQYSRAEALHENDFGISFNPGNSLIERQNAGWCGTPPISFANYKGIWSKNGDIIDISVDFWGGKANHKWKVIDIDAKTITIYSVKSEYIYKD